MVAPGLLPQPKAPELQPGCSEQQERSVAVWRGSYLTDVRRKGFQLAKTQQTQALEGGQSLLGMPPVFYLSLHYHTPDTV